MQDVHPTSAEHNLSDAIARIQQISFEATRPHITKVQCDDGKGQKVEIPIAFLSRGDGKVEAHPLLDALKAGSQFVEHERLRHAEGPDRREGIAAHQALQSFIDHANRFKAPHSAIWADAARRQLVSVLDYHPAGAESPARWGKHRGTYACPLSEAWQAWGGGKELVLDQDAFAAVLDQRDRELAAGDFPNGKTAPDPAFLLTLAANLEVFANTSAKRARDPNTGRVKLTFIEEKGVAGELAPPPSFLIAIPVFQDAAPQALEVRLRVEVQEGHARFHVQIHAAGDVLRDAFNELCSRVATATELPLFVGTPE